MDWFTPIPASSSSRKRSSVSAGALGTIALGTDGGAIVLWNLALGTNERLVESAQGAVNDLQFSEDGKVLYSCYQNSPDIHIWNVAAKKIMNTMTGKEQSVSNILKSGERLVVSNILSRVYDTKDGKTLSTYPGDSIPSKILIAASEDYFINGVGDRSLNMYPIVQKTGKTVKVKSANQKFIAGTEIVNATFSKYSSDLLAVLEDGTVVVWNVNLEAKDNTPMTPMCEIRCKNSKILHATFATNDSIVLAVGEAILPAFEFVTYRSNDGLIEEVLAEGVETKSMLMGAEPEKKKGTGSQIHTIAPRDAPATTVEDVEQEMSEDDEEGEISLEERVAALTEQMKVELPKTEVTHIRKNKSQSHSLISTLTQALQTTDMDKIDYVLGVGRENVINATVVKLEAKDIVRFLSIIIDRLEKSPNRAASLMKWIRSVLSLHTSQLMAQQDLVGRLMGLYKTIEHRLKSHKKLLKLSGRLDLILAHMEPTHVEPVSRKPVNEISISVLEKEAEEVEASEEETSEDEDSSSSSDSSESESDSDDSSDSSGSSDSDDTSSDEE
eukprot:TRINITY_DN779999_c0_g1_i1.p1 TRINITY_DN779999_c0_g1~~TRINITY_DN779999_c0_g1_i1.p1  ORF type:complete len:613 (+),score=193.86 TRINITY_DN779999_c0_g1_i1:177-1841(+)